MAAKRGGGGGSATATAKGRKRRASARTPKPAQISSPKGRPSKPYDLKKAAFAKKFFVPDLPPSPAPTPPPPPKSLATVSDLKDLASSGLDSLKGRLELLHSEAIKEIDVSVSRVSKKFKVQTKSCLQLTEEAEKEYRKASDMINEAAGSIKVSYAKLINVAQGAASRVCKVSIPQLGKSMEKAIGDLRSHYKIPLTSA